MSKKRNKSESWTLNRHSFSGYLHPHLHIHAYFYTDRYNIFIDTRFFQNVLIFTWKEGPQIDNFVEATKYIIIITIMSCRQNRYRWTSLATSPYRSSPLEDLQGCIPYPHTTAVCMFKLAVLLLLGHMWGSIGVHHLWASPAVSCMSGSSSLDSFRDGRSVAV